MKGTFLTKSLAAEAATQPISTGEKATVVRGGSGWIRIRVLDRTALVAGWLVADSVRRVSEREKATAAMLLPQRRCPCHSKG